MFSRAFLLFALAFSATAAPYRGLDVGLDTGLVLRGDEHCSPGYPTPTATVTITVTLGGPPPPTSTSVYVPPPPPTSVWVPPPATTYVPPPATTHVPPPTTTHVPPPATTYVPPPPATTAATSGGGGSGYTCNSAPAQCCNQVQSSKSLDFASILPGALLGLLPINLQGLDVPVGVDCSPIDILGLGGVSCNQQTVCCENNNFSGLIAIGCMPINIGL